MRKLDITKTCIVKPVIPGGVIHEFSCEVLAVVDGDLPKFCPFCKLPINSLTEEYS